MVYTGYRPVLPGQNTNDWRHHQTGEQGVYSSYQLMSPTQALQDMPLEHYEPFEGVLAQQFTGTHSYSPMELKKYSHGGQRAAYLRHKRWEFHGVPGADVFPEGYGEKWEPGNDDDDKIPAAFRLKDAGHAQRGYGEGASGFGPYEPWEYHGVGEDPMKDPGQEAEHEDRYIGFERVNEHHGVPSSKVL